MAFSDRILTLAGLVTIALPDATIRLCDGGQVIWGADVFRAKAESWGSIGQLNGFEESVGDDAPGATLTFLPASAAAAASLALPANQMSAVRFWLAQVDEATGAVVSGAVELIADMLIDTAELKFGRGARRLELGLVSAADRLFEINIGNVLSGPFHRSLWPGEQGLDNAVDVGTTVAWRSKAPPRGSVTTAAPAYGGSGGGGGLFVPEAVT